MKSPTVAQNEPQRLGALTEYAVLDTAAEPSFDALTRLAAEILDVPIALISLIDVDRQWFKSCYGLEATETPREVSFCGHVVANDAPLVVPDACLDDRFCDNPLVTGGPRVRFYAGMPLRTPDGFVLGTLCAIDNQQRQVTERQLSMLELLARQVMELMELRRRSHMLHQFQVTLDAAVDAIFIFEPVTLRFLYANRGAVTMLGYSFDELRSMTLMDLKSPSDRAVLRSHLDSLLRGDGTEASFEATHLDKMGRKVPVELTLQYLAPSGEPARFIQIARDTSERTRLDELKQQFLSTVSHELRTPLTSIRGALGLVSAGVTGELPAQAKEYVDVAVSNTDRLMRLINDLLDIEKARTQKLEFQAAPLSLQSLARDAIKASQALALSLGVDLLLHEEPTPDVLGNEDRVSQVIANLVSNALKFSNPGQRIELSVSHDNGRVRLAVCDHGAGVPVSFRARLFERFAQADGSDTRPRGGSGLGLNISKTLVEAMNGEIGFAPTEGGGATFFFELPMKSTKVSSVGTAVAVSSPQ